MPGFKVGDVRMDDIDDISGLVILLRFGGE